jgi:hypothetical protein
MTDKQDQHLSISIYRAEYNELEAIKRQLSAEKGAPLSFAFVIRERVKYYNLGHQKGKR